jgi:FkbM family methyltransferase
MIETLRRHLRRRLKLDIVSADNTTTLRHHLGEVLRIYRIDTVLDVGANEGQFGAMLREMGFAGDIHSFEPIKETFALLQARAAGDARWHCHNIALGRSPGTLVMNVSEFSTFSSALKANAFGSGRFHDLRQIREEEVAVSTGVLGKRPLPGEPQRRSVAHRGRLRHGQSRASLTSAAHRPGVRPKRAAK